jgi:hypothetical protein
MAQTTEARARAAARDWDKALAGVGLPHAGHRAVALRLVEDVRPQTDVTSLAHHWLRAAGCDVWPAQAPFLWEGRRGKHRVLVCAVVDDGLAAVQRYVALRLSERVAQEAAAGADILLLGFSYKAGYPRCTVERWLSADGDSGV